MRKLGLLFAALLLAGCELYYSPTPAPYKPYKPDINIVTFDVNVCATLPNDQECRCLEYYEEWSDAESCWNWYQDWYYDTYCYVECDWVYYDYPYYEWVEECWEECY